MKIPENILPGRRSKLAGRGAELWELRQAGYTNGSIQKILEANGIDVSEEAVRKALIRYQSKSTPRARVEAQPVAIDAPLRPPKPPAKALPAAQNQPAREPMDKDGITAFFAAAELKSPLLNRVLKGKK